MLFKLVDSERRVSTTDQIPVFGTIYLIYTLLEVRACACVCVRACGVGGVLDVDMGDDGGGVLKLANYIINPKVDRH